MEGLKINTPEMIEKAGEFLENYAAQISDKIRRGKNHLVVSFSDLEKYEYSLAEELLEGPEDILKAAELAILDKYGVPNFFVRFKDIPKHESVRIRDIRSKFINKFISVTGIVKSKSDVRPKITSVKFECPSCGGCLTVFQSGTLLKEPHKCLKKGTLVLTPEGYKAIEDVKEVICVDYNGELIKEDAKVINAGKKEIWKINNEIECSSDHLWFVFKDGKCRFLPTKHLNIGDILLMINEKNLYNLSKGIRTDCKDNKKNRQRDVQDKIFEQTNLFSRVCDKTFFSLPKRNSQNRGRYKKSNRHVSEQEIWDAEHSPQIRCKQEGNFSKTERKQNTNKKLTRTEVDRYTGGKNDLSDRRGELELQAWKEMWRTILQKTNKGGGFRRMPILRNKNRISSSPQRFKSLKPPYKQPCSPVQFMPYEITRIDKITKKVDMYDLQVPDYNNFILKNGIVSHNCSCGKKGKFTILEKKMIDGFTMTLEETPESITSGTEFKKLHIFVKDDLADIQIEDKIFPGGRVSINGILKEFIKQTKHGQSTEIDFFLEANYITFLESTFQDLKVTPEEEEKIIELSKNERLLDTISKSVFGSHYGHDMVKAAIILQAFGGISSKTDKRIKRGMIHILLLGDPGIGKSALLLMCKRFLPKARYVVGRGASGAGLCAAVVKDELVGGWCVEAGALPLCHEGVCIIDELDKIGEKEVYALHEPLENCTVTISKAGVHMTLLAETAVLAAANPKFGRFDPNRDIYEQINFEPTLVNRFDLIFPFKDVINEEHDEKTALKILLDDKEKEEISPDLIKKYISYAKRINPIIPESIGRQVAQKYKEIRQTGEGKSFPITPRQVTAIRRLMEAYSRMKLHKEVQEEDMNYALAMVCKNLSEIGLDPMTGKIDTDKISLGITMSQRKKIDTILGIIQELENKIGNLIPVEDIIVACKTAGIMESECEQTVEMLIRKGEIYEPRPGFISKL